MIGSDGEKVQRTVDRVARDSYGRLVAYLSVHTQDLRHAVAWRKILRVGCSRRRATRSSISSVISG